MIKGFRDFIMRGNVVDLAVAVVIGLAFSAVVDALVKWILTPLIAMIFGKPNLDNVLTFTINNAGFSIGAVLTQLVNFVLIAGAIYFFVIVPMNQLQSMRSRGQADTPEATPADIALLTEIRDLLRARQL